MPKPSPNAALKGLETLARLGATVNRVSRDVLVVFSATTVANGLSWLLNLVLAKLMAPEDFGAFVSLLAFLLIASFTYEAAAMTVARSVADLVARGRQGEAHSLTRKALLQGGLVGLLLSVLGILASSGIAKFLQIPSSESVLVLGLTYLPMVVSSIALGYLRGRSRFFRLGVLFVCSAALRFILTAGMVYAGLGLVGAMLGNLLGSVVVSLLSLLFTRDIWKSPPEALSQMNRFYALGWHALVGTVAYASLTNLHLPLVKHLFRPIDAGNYSALATMGKVVLFFPGAVGLVMLPRLSQRLASGEDPVPLLRFSFLIVVFACTAIILGFLTFPVQLIELMVGDKYLGVAPLLGWYGLVCAGYTLVNLWFTFHLAVGEKFFSYMLAAAAVLQMVAIWVWHPGIGEVIAILGASSAVLVVGGEMELWRAKHQRHLLKQPPKEAE